MISAHDQKPVTPSLFDKSNQFVFVGGASRSGTSLMCRLFDWHLQALVFSPEVSLIQKYWSCPEPEREAYFRSKFLTPSEGKQARFVDQRFAKQEIHRLNTELNANPTILCDKDIFLQTYLGELQKDGSSLLRRVGQGLGTAIIRSHQILAERYCNGKIRLMVFKHPFFTELYAQDTAKILPNCRFIHLIRSPFDRYISAKLRKLGQKWVSSQHTDLCFSLSRTWIASNYLATKNTEIIGSDRYRVIHYEKLLRNPAHEMRQLAEWLEIDFDNSLIRATDMGREAIAKSSFNHIKINSSLVFKSREKEFYKYTSISERLQFYYLLHIVTDLIEKYPIPEAKLLYVRLLRWIPFRFEKKADYFKRILGRIQNPTALSKDELRSYLTKQFIQLAKKKPREVG